MNTPFRNLRFITALSLAVAAISGLSAADRTDNALPPAKASERTTDKSASKAAAKIDLNTANAAELASLPGVGLETAKAIIAARPFASVADLERVGGIGKVKLNTLSGLVTVSAPSPAASLSRSSGRAATVDINTADIEALETLPGVGPQTARAIVAARPFASESDLERVSGIGAAKMKELRPLITASRVPAAKTDRTASSQATGPANAPTGRTSEVGTKSTTLAAKRLVNLNTASREELEALPEIGPVKAQAIIEARPFKSVDDVTRVKGIKEATLEAIRDQVTVR